MKTRQGRALLGLLAVVLLLQQHLQLLLQGVLLTRNKGRLRLLHALLLHLLPLLAPELVPLLQER